MNKNYIINLSSCNRDYTQFLADHVSRIYINRYNRYSSIDFSCRYSENICLALMIAS